MPSLSVSRPAEVRAYLSARSVHNPITGCQIWQRSTSSQGKYGTLWIDGTIAYAHRIAFLIASGELPDGSLGHASSSLEVHHRCGNRLCIEPSHLELVTRHEHSAMHQPIKAAVQLAKAA